MSLEITSEHYQLKRRIVKHAAALCIVLSVALGAWLWLLLAPAHAASADHFVTTWKTDNSGVSNNTSITIPTFPGETYNYDVDWDNDGTFDEGETGYTGDATHDFGTPGTYTIRIQGQFPRIYFNLAGDRQKIVNVNQWGTGVWASMEGAFFGASNLKSDATDIPNLSNVADMSRMFGSASLLNSNFSDWDVSNVTNMSGMFNYATSFNGDLSGWNVSNVTNMSSMFNYATSFNSDLSGWNVSSVANMAGMFNGASSFSGDLSSWDVSSATNMAGMFSSASSFNSDLSGWNVSNVTNMSVMLTGTDSMTIQNYEALLISWAAQPVHQGLSFSIGSLMYCSNEAAQARVSLVEDKAWTIVDGGSCSDISISSISPSSVTADGTDKTVSIYGSHFVEGATVYVGNQEVEIQSLSSTQIDIIVSTEGITETTTVDITVTNPNGPLYTLSDGFTYISAPAPQISSLATNNAGLGVAVHTNIYGSNFQQGATVTVGGQPTIVKYISNTSISVIFPASSTLGIVDVVVANPDGKSATLSGGFTYRPNQMEVEEIWPSSISVDGSDKYLDISGRDFAEGATVLIGDQELTPDYLEDDYIGVVVPTEGLIAGAVIGVTVVNPGGSSFTLPESLTLREAGTPYIEGVWPGVIVADGSDKYLDIEGQDFIEGATVMIGDLELTPDYLEDSYIGVIIPTEGLVVGTAVVDVTVINPGGARFTLASSLTLREAGAPYVEEISPNTVVVDGSDKQVTIRGGGFMGSMMPLRGMFGVNYLGDLEVKFGDKVVSIDSATTGRINVIVPTAGITETTTVDITVTNPNGKSFTLEDAFTFNIPPPKTITAVEFSEQDGKKMMVIKGTELVVGAGSAEGLDLLIVPYVSLNGTPLPACTEGSGSTAQEMQDALEGMFGGQLPWALNLSDTPTCYLIGEFSNILLTPTQVTIWLANDFDVTKPGFVGVNGFDMAALMQGSIVLDDYVYYGFNQPTPAVNNKPVTGTPTITKRPTFTGVAPAGSTVIVTVNSDPVTCTTTADSNGNWSCTLPSDLPAGNHTVNVVVITPDNQTLTYGPYSVTVAADGSSTPLAPDSGVAPAHKLFWLMMGGAGAALLAGVGIFALRDAADRTYDVNNK